MLLKMVGLMTPSVAFKASAACPVKGIDFAETEVKNPWSALYAKGDWILFLYS